MNAKKTLQAAQAIIDAARDLLHQPANLAFDNVNRITNAAALLAAEAAAEVRREATKNAKHQDRATLLSVLYSYKIIIERGAADYPRAVLDDLQKSIDYVLTRNEYTAADYKNRTKGGARNE